MHKSMIHLKILTTSKLVFALFSYHHRHLVSPFYMHGVIHGAKRFLGVMSKWKGLALVWEVWLGIVFSKGLKIWGSLILVLDVLTRVHLFVILLILIDFTNIRWLISYFGSWLSERPTCVMRVVDFVYCIDFVFFPTNSQTPSLANKFTLPINNF